MDVQLGWWVKDLSQYQLSSHIQVSILEHKLRNTKHCHSVYNYSTLYNSVEYSAAQHLK